MATRTASLSQALPGVAAELQLLPAGRFRAADGSGRPLGLEGWYIDAEIAGRLIAAANARSNRLVVDYEHQTLYTEKNGQPAPAAGWIDPRSLTWREGQGLFAQVEWTERARTMIAGAEYRYLSPVFTFDDATGEVLRLLHFALVNHAGLDGLTVAALAALNPAPQEEHPVMNETLKKLLGALGMSADADEAAALSAVAALKDKADGLDAEVAALKAQPAQPDPAKYVPVGAVKIMHEQVAALTARIEGAERAAMIEAGLADGRLNPALTEWANAQPIASLRAFLEVAAPVAALTGMQSDRAGVSGASHTPTPSDADVAVMKALGLTAAEFAAAKLQEK